MATAALSKYRGDHLLRALKAHALERTGKASEALTVRLETLPLKRSNDFESEWTSCVPVGDLNHVCIPVSPISCLSAVERCKCAQLCDDVRKDTPTDTHVLHTLRLVYAREGRHGEVTAMYQAAAAAAPGDATLQEGVFASLVRYRADRFRQ